MCERNAASGATQSISAKKIESRKDGPRTLVDVASLNATTEVHAEL
ncbi:MAG: hypothetical protein WBD95_15045 [Xanthobacteraceae bacterium]